MVVQGGLDVAVGKLNMFEIVIWCQNQVPHCTLPWGGGRDKEKGIKGVWIKRGSHIKPEKLRGGLHAGPYKLRHQKEPHRIV